MSYTMYMYINVLGRTVVKHVSTIGIVSKLSLITSIVLNVNKTATFTEFAQIVHPR